MKVLPFEKPTKEQLPIVANPRPGVTLIRGAAGCGKTTTALLMLRQLSSFWIRTFERMGSTDKPKILVLTFNRTLRGYIRELAASQVATLDKIQLSVATFGNWSKSLTGWDDILQGAEEQSVIQRLGRNLPLTPEFIGDEVDYCLGRFLPADLAEYLSKRRVGRGASPRMDKDLRQRLLDEVVHPYQDWKRRRRRTDWNDISVELLGTTPMEKYQVIIADEAQDFSANQLRTVMHHAADRSSVVFVLDAAQRIYPRGCTWAEVGITIDRSFSLKQNHRNTRQICEFAAPLIEGIELGDDAAIPDLNSCTRAGPRPVVLKGKFTAQCEYAIRYIRTKVDLAGESVGFLHPKGWFKYLREQLDVSRLEYVEMTRRDGWPQGPTNIGLTTMHSAKGLEFDHVFLLGLGANTLLHGNEEGDTKLETLRRMLAMSVTRARMSVTLGYKEGEETDLIRFFKTGTYTAVTL